MAKKCARGSVDPAATGEKVVDDAGVIEDEADAAELGRCQYVDGFGIIGSDGVTDGVTNENARNGVKPRISPGGRIDPLKMTDGDYEGDLFAHFAKQGITDGFAAIDKSTRQRPTQRRIFPLDHDDASIFKADNAVDG